MERVGFNNRIELKKIRPGDEIHDKAVQGLSDNPLRATVYFGLWVGEKSNFYFFPIL